MGDGTAAPEIPLPPFIETWNKTSEKEAHVFKKDAGGPYQKVKLFDFIFLGKNFAPMTYVGRTGSATGPVAVEFTAGGVCRELASVLQKAQVRIYRSYAAQATSKGETPTESGFVAFCGIKVVAGWQFRGGQHRFGSAIDIDANDNPYTVTKTGGVVGGEALADMNQTKVTALRARAMKVYENAWRLVKGAGLPENQMAGFNDPAPNPSDAYDRMVEMHHVFRTYLQMALFPGATNDIKASKIMTRTFDEPGDPSSFAAQLKRHEPFLKGLKPDTKREELFNQIIDDYEVMKVVFAKGPLRDATPGVGNTGFAPAVGSRDPAWGFLTIRKEVVVGIWGAESPMRWGGVHFGARINGDMMHFDRGQDAITATTDDPNPQNLFFTKK